MRRRKSPDLMLPQIGASKANELVSEGIWFERPDPLRRGNVLNSLEDAPCRGRLNGPYIQRAAVRAAWGSIPASSAFQVPQYHF